MNLWKRLTGTVTGSFLVLLAGIFLAAIPQVATAAPPAFDSLFHQSYAVRSVYHDQVVTPYLSSLPETDRWKVLDALQQRAVKEQDYPAELELMISRIELQDKAGLIGTDEKIRRLEQLLAGLDRNRHAEYAAVTMHFLAQNYYGKKRNYTLAFEHYINAYHIATKLNQKDFPDKKPILLYLGNRYYTIGDYTKAQRILEEADSLVHPWDKSLAYYAKNTLGLIYRNRGQYAKAISLFGQARSLASAQGDQVWAAIASGNIGICYYQQKDYGRAVPLLQEDIGGSFSRPGEAADNGINSLMILADIHLKRKDLSAVDTCIRLAQRYLDSCRDKVKALGAMYPLMARYYYARGDYKTAYGYRDAAALYSDSLFARDNIYKLARVEHRNDMEKAATELGRLSAEKKLLSFTRNGLLLGILLLLVIAVLIVNRQRLRHRLKQVNILSEKRQAEQELRTATKELESFTRRLQEKNLLIEQSGQEIEKLRSAAARISDMQQETGDVLQQLYSSTILTDEEWHSFKLLFEQVHKGYLQRLREKMPELTPADTRFMVLSKLNLTNKEMAGILGVQPDTIRSYKYRLRKRFDLPEEENIKEFIDSI